MYGHWNQSILTVWRIDRRFLLWVAISTVTDYCISDHLGIFCQITQSLVISKMALLSKDHILWVLEEGNKIPDIMTRISMMKFWTWRIIVVRFLHNHCGHSNNKHDDHSLSQVKWGVNQYWILLKFIFLLLFWSQNTTQKSNNIFASILWSEAMVCDLFLRSMVRLLCLLSETYPSIVGQQWVVWLNETICGLNYLLSNQNRQNIS